MFKLAALNDKEIENEAKNADANAKGTKEAQEVHAFDLYNKALQLQRDNQHELAFTVYEQLLKTSLVTDAASTLVDENGEATERPLKDPGLILKYSTHKNLASISADKGDIETAMEHYLQAVMLDTTDVTLWQRIGSHAITLGKLALARHAFTSGLTCNENYWPCLDSAVTVLYALLDYESSLYWISKALERNPEYAKGLVLREKMYQDCPHLRKDTQYLFRNSDFSLYDLEIDEEEVKEYIEEGLTLRKRHKESCRSVPPADVPIKPALTDLTWVCLGKSLIETYNYIFNADDNAKFTSSCIFDNIKTLEVKFELKKQTKGTKVNEEKAINEEAAKPSPYVSGEMSEDSVDSILAQDMTTETSMSAPARISVSFDLSVTDNFYSSQDSTQDGASGTDNGVAMATEVRELVASLVDEVARATVTPAAPRNAPNAVAKLVNEMVLLVAGEIEAGLEDRGGGRDVQDVVRSLLNDVVRNVDGSKTAQNDMNDESPPKLQGLSLKAKRATKRKRNLADVLDEHSKRRSTRVRVSTKKGQQQQILKIISPPPLKTDYLSKLVKILPKTLHGNNCEKDDATKGKETSSTKEPSRGNLNKSDPTPNVYDAINEAGDVLDFLKANDGVEIVNLLQKFCFALSDKVFLLWPNGTKEVILQAFSCIHPHIQYLEPEEVEGEESISIYRDSLYNALNFVECQIDHYEKKTKNRLGITVGELETLLLTLETALPHRRLFRTSSDDLLPNPDLRQFGLRFLWARSKLTSSCRPSNIVVRDLNVCKDLLETACRAYDKSESPSSPEHGKFFLHLPNLQFGSIISMKTVKERLEILERKQVLDDVKRLFESESYSEVVQLLKSTLTDKPQVSTNPERPRQIRQLLISHEKMQDKMGVVESSRCAVAEIIFNAQRASASKENRGEEMVESQSNKRSLKEWTSTLHVVLQILDRALEDEVSIFENLETGDRGDLCRGLASAVDFIFTELDDGRSFLAKPTVSSIATLLWIIMYKLVKFEERDVNFVCDVTELPSSFNVLSTAHQWTGERGMCCHNDGMLPQFIIEEYNSRFKKIKHLLLSAMRDALTRLVEQCFYCMFNYPSKGKVRYLQDHNVKQLTATWSDYLAMFGFARPPHLPEFDSIKAISVSQDLAQLILRALNYVPKSVQAQIPNSDSDVANFVESSRDDVTEVLTSLEGDASDVRALGDMYYLLGDYNFKNKEMAKAVKYYLLDLRINPTRFDSWAGMALARSSQTDDRLRLCEAKKSQHKTSDSGTEKKGLVALSCFKRALSFETGNGTLWIEYGSLAYWMHSMYSRQLKRKSSNLTDEERRIIKDKKADMLNIARKCFQVVRESDSDDVYDEEWLIEYMIGKLCEKEGKPLNEYLRCYQSSAEILHRRHAKYPKRILPKYAAVNDLAIEALEMYFRVHASMLKYLIVRIKNTDVSSGQPVEYDVTNDDVALMKDVVEQMAKSPFVHREERKPTSQFSVADPEKPTKLAVVSESTDLTMGSLLPDSVINALHIEVEEKTDDDTQLSVQSTDGDTQETVKSEKTQSPPTTNQAISPNDSTQSQYIEDKKDPVVAVEAKPEKMSRHREDCEAIIDACESAIRLCLRRYPQHNKSVYRLAHLYSSPGTRKHLNWARDLLFGSPSPWQQKRHMPAAGLLADRNKTNLFNGVWRIPMDEIDRPGSFAAHLRRCVALLIDVMRDLGEHESLLHIHNLLNRIPDHGRKYLRDDDRTHLARLALVYCRSVLNRRLRQLPKPLVALRANRITKQGSFGRTSIAEAPSGLSGAKGVIESGQHAYNTDMPLADIQEAAHPDKSHSTMDSSESSDVSGGSSAVEDCLNVVMDAYKVYQDTQKHPDSTTKLDREADEDDVTHQRLLADAYHKYTCCVAVHSSNDGNPSVTFHEKLPDSLVTSTFEQAVRFCQRRVHVKKQTASSSTKSQVTSTTTTTSSPKHRPQAPPDSGSNVIHDDAMRSDSGGATAAANHVRDLSIVDEAKGEADSTANNIGSGSNPANDDSKPTEKPLDDNVPKVTMVQKDGKKYTRIGPPAPRPGQHPLVPSRDSAFTSTGGDRAKQKRLRVDPGLKHLQLPSTSDMNGSHSKRLVRSTSVPVPQAHRDEDDADAENKPPFNAHRAIYRTGSSVSDYTLDRLKKSILARTSAALVRKPSITEQEIMQITNDVDYDSSSQSEDEDDAQNDDGSRSNKRKYCEDDPSNPINTESFTDAPVTSPLAAVQSTAITTAGST